MTDASRYLVTLAARVAGQYVNHTAPRAILLTGSAAEGVSDTYSDLDLITYQDQLPTDVSLAVTRSAIGATDVHVSSLAESGSMLVEQYSVHGVECQLAHCTLTSWEENMASVLDVFTPGTLAEKAIIGLQNGIALHGHEQIAQWQARAAVYPEELAPATVTHHLQFFPLWLAAERWPVRDATIFHYQMLVDTSLKLLGVLAGLNRRYFSTFQFKRLRRFAASLPLAPERLADRLDELFTLNPVSAAIELERLADETVTLVETHMPMIHTSSARKLIGMRHQPWSPIA